MLNRQPIDAAAYQADHRKRIDGGGKPEDRPVSANDSLMRPFTIVDPTIPCGRHTGGSRQEKG
ncbi:hypothetical protein ACWGIU_14755 [Streptomyces sp. NPDC054840]